MRECHNCGWTYNRCNTTRNWVRQAPGSRKGWVKETISICTWCQNAEKSARIMILAGNSVLSIKEVNQRRIAAGIKDERLGNKKSKTQKRRKSNGG